MASSSALHGHSLLHAPACLRSNRSRRLDRFFAAIAVDKVVKAVVA